jgi:hypothetical protein
MIKLEETLSLYSNKYNPSIASGATPIGSADRADACKMHQWSLHFTTWYSTLFASYIGYIHAFFMIIGNN